MQRYVADTTPIIFLMVDSTDHITGKTGLTVTLTRSKAGGAFGAVTGTVAEISSGFYKLTPAAGDVDTAGELGLHATATGADPMDTIRILVPEPVAAVIAAFKADTILKKVVARIGGFFTATYPTAGQAGNAVVVYKDPADGTTTVITDTVPLDVNGRPTSSTAA